MTIERYGRPRRAPDGILATLRQLAQSPGLLRQASRDYAFRAELAQACEELAARAYPEAVAGAAGPAGSTASRDAARAELHAVIAHIHRHDLSPASVTGTDEEWQPVHRDIAALLEAAMLGHELSRIPGSAVTGYPEHGPDYVRWLKTLVNEHPAGWHPLYHQHLPASTNWTDLRLLLAQETSLDPRFDDILALMQVGRQGGEKLEIAANYWDEMGNGDPSQVHTHLFARALDSLGADAAYISATLLPEAVVSGNLSACLALSRRHYYKAVGYFGVTEYLAPRRFRHVVDTWRRHQLAEVGVVYHDLHIGVDAGHASGWFRNVVSPLVAADPRAGREIATGALIRLNSSADYLDALLTRMRTAPEEAPVPAVGA